MNYILSDSSGTDDDLPPSHQNRFASRGQASGNGRSTVFGTSQFPRMQSEMEIQIHQLEQEAYSAVLRAFKAQSDAITWEMESLITELRKELRVSDEEHRVLLSQVNADDIIRRIREWRKASGLQPGMHSSSKPVHEPMPSPSRKKQKISQSVSLGAPSPVLQPTRQLSSSALKQGPASGARGKNPKSSASTDFTDRGQVANQVSAGASGINEPNDVSYLDPLIGRKVWTRWPEDNSFYEAVITDFNPVDGCHALVYDIGTPDEAWEWVNLKELFRKAEFLPENKRVQNDHISIFFFGGEVISPDDIRWRSEDIGVSHRGGHSGAGRGIKSMARGGSFAAAPGRGRGAVKSQSKKNLALPQNGVGKKALHDIEILHTDTLIKEVEKIFSSSNADPSEIDKAKEVLKEHEQALVDAIARLIEASDGESDRRQQHPSSQRRSIDQEGSKKQRDKELGGGSVTEGYNCDNVVCGETGLSNQQQETGNPMQ